MKGVQRGWCSRTEACLRLRGAYLSMLGFLKNTAQHAQNCPVILIFRSIRANRAVDVSLIYSNLAVKSAQNFGETGTSSLGSFPIPADECSGLRIMPLSSLLTFL